MINLTLISIIALNVSMMHEYQIDVFDCTDYSLELAYLLTDQGYDVRFAQGKALWCKTGWYNGTYNTCRHDWLQVRDGRTTYNIEPQTGEVLSPEYYKENYRLYWSTPCIKCIYHKYK